MRFYVLSDLHLKKDNELDAIEMIKKVCEKIRILLIYNRVVDKMKVVYPFYESVIIKKPKKVNV